MQLKAGSELQNGKYRIIRVLGQGGFGITYLASGARGKHIAIKEFFPSGQCIRNEETGYVSLSNEMTGPKKKFISEAQKITLLHHKNIVKVIEVFEENGTAYYAMKYIKGEPLADLIRSKSFSIEESLEIIKQVAEAIGHIHSKRMLHLDIKPTNIMMCSSNNVPVVIDFGISKTYDDQGNANTTLFPAASLGYASVEQLNGEVNNFAPQLDIYSLGATFYSTLTGQLPPYPSESTTNRLNFPSNIPIKIKGIVMKAMAYHPADRYSSIKEFLKDFSYNNKSDKQKQDNIENNVSIENARPIIRSFRVVNEAPYQIGDEIQIRWSIQNAEQVFLNGKPLDISIKSKKIRYSTLGNKRLVLKAKNSAGEISRTLNFEIENNQEDSKSKTATTEGKEDTNLIIADFVKPISPTIKFLRRVDTKRVYVGDIVTLEWEIEGANSIAINGEILPSNYNAYKIKILNQGENTISLKATNTGGTVEKELAIYAKSKEAPEISYLVTWNLPSEVFLGDIINVHWKVNDAESVTLNNVNVPIQAREKNIKITNDGVFEVILTAKNKFGTTKKIKKITVTPKKNSLYLKQPSSNKNSSCDVETVHADNNEEQISKQNDTICFIVSFLINGILMAIWIWITSNLITLSASDWKLWVIGVLPFLIILFFSCKKLKK